MLILFSSICTSWAKNLNEAKEKQLRSKADNLWTKRGRHWGNQQPINKSLLSAVCPSVLPDGRPAGGQEDLHHQRRPAVPQALLRGGGYDQPGLLHTTLSAAAGRHQSQGVSMIIHSGIHPQQTESTSCSDSTFFPPSCRIVKIPDNPESLSFRLSGSEPPHVHAVRKGESRASGAKSLPDFTFIFFFFTYIDLEVSYPPWYDGMNFKGNYNKEMGNCFW